jgi:hypothetical protein
MLVAFATFPPELRASRGRTQQAEAAATALLSGVPDKDAVEALYLDPVVVWRDADYFRQQHLFMFSDLKNDQVGQPLSSTFQTSPPQQCEGQVTTVQQLQPGELLGDGDIGALGISGWATNRFSRAPVRRLVFVSNDKIVGYGASIAGSSAAKPGEIAPKRGSDKWLGFIRPPSKAASIDVYALDDNANAVCHVATVQLPQQ